MSVTRPSESVVLVRLPFASYSYCVVRPAASMSAVIRLLSSRTYVVSCPWALASAVPWRLPLKRWVVLWPFRSVTVSGRLLPPELRQPAWKLSQGPGVGHLGARFTPGLGAGLQQPPVRL